MKIGIVGLGLIGGSLGLDLRRQGHWVAGVARRPQLCEAAVAHQVADQASCNLSSLADVDVVFVCTPIAAIEPTVVELVAHLRSSTIITDVGSVKGSVVVAATRHWPRFVGGHPMAGKTQSGLMAAQPQLFVQRAYVLTPLEITPLDAVDTVAALAEQVGAVVYRCAPTVHDQAVAWISHLPVMVSSSLIRACCQEPDPTVLTLAQRFASSGFRDTSRVGGGVPELGLMMARFNRQELLRSLQGYRQQLDAVMDWIETENWPALEQHLHQTQRARPAFVEEKPQSDPS
ncbi:Prephenate dehydrogenase [Halomicronema hongdechloris C2206]|uniref:Prephenate dehydrogenase n=1 Tax=Halomicronema hongdechloris C2206 TaxID=1641165 RepID=A0A1Z3HI70_9CYAN|nr:Prephenate dehydrogenase [Halomicronema hongdechloris C2206]